MRHFGPQGLGRPKTRQRCTMDLADDERIRHLNELIQNEKDPAKLTDLTNELLRLIDERKPAIPRADSSSKD